MQSDLEVRVPGLGMDRLWVGTSGWQYRHWKDSYYAGVPQRRWLEAYADDFRTVEVNSTFYGLPRPSSVERWTQQVPPGFRFTVKMWRGVTHYRRLDGCEDLLERFFQAIGPLLPMHLGAILVQLPPQMARDVRRLDSFLDDLGKAAPDAHGHVAFEFRHPSWLDDRTMEVLEDHGAVAALHDMTRAAPHDEAGASSEAGVVYLRRHGPGGDMSRGYKREALHRDVQRVSDWLDEGRTVYVYYNNDINGHAPRDALRLLQEVEDLQARGPPARRRPSRARPQDRLLAHEA